MPKKQITVADIVQVFGECELLDERGIFVPITENWKNDKFDIDLDFGKVGEKKVEEMLEGEGSVEVKYERDIWKRTGNIAIEFRCRGKLSGISTTTAKTWIHMLNGGGGGFIFPVKDLKEKIRKKNKEGSLVIKMIGDDNASECAILPIAELFI